MNTRQFETGQGVHRVEAQVTFCGEDLVVCLGGGDTPHVGAVALALPRPSLADSNQPSASASVLCVTGHKEDELARAIGLELATEFGCKVSVSAGLHVDNATPDDITLLQHNSAHIVSELKGFLRDRQQ
jgi:hypothetical protein